MKILLFMLFLCVLITITMGQYPDIINSWYRLLNYKKMSINNINRIITIQNIGSLWENTEASTESIDNNLSLVRM